MNKIDVKVNIFKDLLKVIPKGKLIVKAKEKQDIPIAHQFEQLLNWCDCSEMSNNNGVCDDTIWICPRCKKKEGV